ncbi:unnamed protein product [Symbiodinium sp. KB8]|nr:unnamed protein product [Symbiodinium sp. KB8]
MVEAWYMDEDTKSDQRLEHRQSPNKPATLEDLERIGVLYWKLSGDADDEQLKKLREERGYNYTDVITCCPAKLENYDQKIKSFFEEHLHADEEIRYVQAGSGYFDVRDKDDRWIRIAVKKGDLIVLPEGIYHRFTLDTNDYIEAMRLFKGEPVWTPYNRPQEDHPSRQKYVESFNVACGQ